jgi:hypothetical protein
MNKFNDFISYYGLDFKLADQEKSVKNIVFIDYCRVRDKYDFIEDMAEGFSDFSITVIDGNMTKELKSHLFNVDYVTPPPEIYYMPQIKLTPQGLKNNSDIPPILEKAVSLFYLHAQQTNNYVDENIIRNCVRTAFNFTLLHLKTIKPRFIFLWNQFHPLSQAADCAAKLLGITVIYVEYGVLPGTFNIDVAGQMGESWVANNSKSFNELPLTLSDIEKAKLIMEDLRLTGMNRRDQKESDFDNLSDYVKYLANDRPVIFFAGHNDLASGMYPYTINSKTYHSPIFKSSFDAISYIIELAKELGYYVIYKPHPFFSGESESFDKNDVYCVRDININDCVDVSDVVCTVLSQVSYLALLRDKPLILLGFNQMSGKGICYEAYVKKDVRSAFEKAVAREGYDTFVKLSIEHIARLIKYYLYSWSSKNNEFSFLSFTNLAKRIKENSVKTEKNNIGI